MTAINLASDSCLNADVLESQRLDCLHAVFRRLFEVAENTSLCGGADEPLYEPASTPLEKHCIYYTRNYLSSALHEIAHWCIAGAQRRAQRDYGYWYAPDGRDAEQQSRFEQVEVAPQAVEWHLALACGHRFRVSADNLESGFAPSALFCERIVEQARLYSQLGLPERALRLASELHRLSGLPLPRVEDFTLGVLR